MKRNEVVAVEVLMGKWGNGNQRTRALESCGYDPKAIQSIVNSLIDGSFFDDENNNANKNETIEIEVDLNKYDGVCLTFVRGDE